VNKERNQHAERENKKPRQPAKANERNHAPPVGYVHDPKKPPTTTTERGKRESHDRRMKDREGENVATEGAED